MELKIKKLHPDAKIPTYGTDGAACFDLYALDLFRSEDSGREVRVDSSSHFGTGIAFEVPPGWVMMIYSRSGHGFNSGVRLSNCVGVVDSDYRGEVRVKLTRDRGHALDKPLVVRHGDRIAQAMLVPVERVTFAEFDELDATERGTGGFGSTGA